MRRREFIALLGGAATAWPLAAHAQQCSVVVAVFPTVEGSYEYAIDTEGYGALQFVVEDRLLSHTTH
jgi:hypothetical protein